MTSINYPEKHSEKIKKIKRKKYEKFKYKKDEKENEWFLIN